MFNFFLLGALDPIVPTQLACNIALPALYQGILSLHHINMKMMCLPGNLKTMTVRFLAFSNEERLEHSGFLPIHRSINQK